MVLRMIKNKNPVSIVMKDHVIRCVSTKLSANKLTIKQYGERYIPSGIIREGRIVDRDTLIMILEECVEEWNIKKQYVSFVVPDTYIIMRKISVDGDLEGEEIRGELFLEIGSTIHLPFENPVFDFHIIEHEEDKTNLLLFAAPLNIVEEYIDVFEEVHLNPLAADISSLAIYRLYHSLMQVDGSEHTLSLQFSLENIGVSIFNDHMPVFMRQISVALEELRWEVSDNELVWKGEPEVLMSQLEDAFMEIEKVINFYQYSVNHGKEQITRILLTGDHPLYENIIARLEKQFEMPIDVINPELILTDNGDPIEPKYFLPFGLALKEVR
ncbi:type IV pilus biogenesis protein PilM [Bacillus solimangrovi]|nr:pilus assembly protein PilM [Bacillus solimangrovi]